MKIKQILTVVYLLLNTYVFCVGAWQGLLNYPAWTLLGILSSPRFTKPFISERSSSIFPFSYSVFR